MGFRGSVLKNRIFVLFTLFAAFFVSSTATAYGHGTGHHSYASSHRYRVHASYPRAHRSYRSHSTFGSSVRYSRHPNTRKAYGVRRDARGRIARDPHAKVAFRHRNLCPSTGRSSGRCPGYVIDHVRALKRGGPDTAANMQWQTREAAKEKDRSE